MTLEMHPRAGGPYVAKFRAKTGKRRRSSGRTIFDVMLDVVEKLDPHARTEELLAAAEKEVMADGDLIEQAVKHSLVNVLNAVRKAQKSDPHKEEKSGPAAKEATDASKERTGRVLAKARELGVGVSKVLGTILDFTMPNGKQLRHCTFAEVAAAGERFAALAKLGKPDQIVGEVLTAKQAAKL
jgi:hypothetical protein